jgi:S1-C subfamily serine protease
VGESVFVLGYPLTATMGTEIKLTNGIISAKTGFQGDITAYQISVPIQPGNSGAPLFDDQGNLIGIVNAKHLLAENAGYAIKVNYLKNLIELIDNPPVLPSLNNISSKSLPEKVKVLSNFVFIISINE